MSPISFALYENGSLYTTTNDKGIDKDFAEELARRSHCRFEISLMPRARIWQMIEAGRLMMTSSGIQTLERERFAWDVRYLAAKNIVVALKTANASNAAQFEHDAKLYWGVVRGFKHGEVADRFIEDLRVKGRLIEEANERSIFKLLVTHSVDAVIANETAASGYIEQFDLETKVVLADWFPADMPVLGSLMLSKKWFDADEVNKWRAIVREMRIDGTLEKIYTKHLGAAAAKRLLQFTPNDAPVTSLVSGPLSNGVRP